MFSDSKGAAVSTACMGCNDRGMHTGSARADLATCKQLRRLELRLNELQSLSLGLVDALQHIPAFQLLFLSFAGAAFRSLPPNLLTVMALSPSFSTLHLHGPLPSSFSFYFVQSAEATDYCGLSAMLTRSASALLAAQTFRRLRVVVHHRVGRNEEPAVHSFCIVQTREGLEWQEC